MSSAGPTPPRSLEYPRSPQWNQRQCRILATRIALLNMFITVLLLAACEVTGTTTSGGPAASSTSTGTVGSFRVTSVTMAVTPASLAGLACGTNVTVTYTATIHVASGGSGGTVQCSYTVDNGRGETYSSSSTVT